MAVNFNAMIQPQIGTAMMQGDAARQNAMLKTQQMANSQQEMALRQQKFGQEETEYKYLVSERQRVGAAYDRLNKFIEENGGVPGPEAYRAMVDTRNPQMVQMGMQGFQMLKDKEELDGMLAKLARGQQGAPSQPAQPAQLTRPSMIPPPANFSPAPTNALAAPVQPTNALATPREFTREDLIPFTASKDPAANRVATLLAPSKSREAAYLQIVEALRNEKDPKIKELLEGKLKSFGNEFAFLAQPQGAGQTAGVVTGTKGGGPVNFTPVGGAKDAPKLSETDKRYAAHVETEEAAGKVPLPRDQWANEQVKLQAEAKAQIDVQKKLDKDYPKASSAVSFFESGVDKEIRLIDQLLANEAAIRQITGPLAGRVEDKDFVFGSGGREALARFRTLSAAGGLSGLVDLKNSGGTLGSVSNEEGRRLERSRTTATSRTQEASSVIEALKEYKSDLERAKVRTKNSFNETYSYRNNKSAIDPKMPGWGQ